jgi:hypothetical protein
MQSERLTEPVFTLETDGVCSVIRAYGQALWEDFEDDRGFDEVRNQWQPLDEYLFSRLREIHDRLTEEVAVLKRFLEGEE